MSSATAPRCRARRSSGVEPEPELHRHLPVRDRPLCDLAADVHHLEPVEVADRPGRLRHRVADGRPSSGEVPTTSEMEYTWFAMMTSPSARDGPGCGQRQRGRGSLGTRSEAIRPDEDPREEGDAQEQAAMAQHRQPRPVRPAVAGGAGRVPPAAGQPPGQDHQPDRHLDPEQPDADHAHWTGSPGQPGDPGGEGDDPEQAVCAPSSSGGLRDAGLLAEEISRDRVST